VRDLSQPAALPLRPLTTGELLDAAVVLLRTRARRLLVAGFLLALAEQVVLFLLRRAADVDAQFLPATGRLAQFGLLIVVGVGTETLCIGLLGGQAAVTAPRALLGPATPPPRARSLSVTVVAVAAGIVAGATAGAFLILPAPLQVLGLVLASICTVALWPFGYGLVGLAAPAVVIDRLGAGRALWRSVRLAVRTGMRAAWIRVLGYIAWLFIRLGVGFGLVAVLGLWYRSPSSTVDDLVMGGAWLFINALAYPMLGSLDVALHLDTRMRTEGLDISLRRALRRGVSTDTALALAVAGGRGHGRGPGEA
jgi:hypothetical protein